MGRAKVIKPAIQDQPAKFSNLTINGTATFNSTVILDGTVTGSAVPSISPYQSLVANSILPYQGSNNIVSTVKNSVIGGGRFNDISAGSDYGGIIGGEFNLLQHARSFILGANITSSAANTTFANSMSLDGTLSIPGFSNVSASLAAAGGGGGSTPTLQQVTDQGSSTTTPITASIISASGDLFSSKLEITNTSLDDSLLITTTEDSSTAGPVFTFKRNSSSPDNGDYLGQIKFKGENDANQEVIYAKITGKISDVTDTTEDGIIEFATKKAGSNVINARLTSTNFKLINSTGLEVNGDISTDGNVSSSGHISASGFTNVGLTSTTLSSSFTTALNFSTNRIMSVTTGSALTMSIDADTSILGNVIMTDISSSVGLNLPSSEFKVLNGTFDTTKRNYVYYHYIGNDTALVTINQEQ